MIDDRVIQRIGGPQYHQLGSLDEHEAISTFFLPTNAQLLDVQPCARNEADKPLTFGSNDRLLNGCGAHVVDFNSQF